MNCFLLINFLILVWETQIPQIPYDQQFQFVKIADTVSWLCERGQSRQFRISFLIREGYHIQSNSVDDDNLIPTSISLSEIPLGIRLGDPEFPESSEFCLTGSNDTLKVFHNLLTIGFTGMVRHEAEPGLSIIRGMLHYQACDSVKCFFPRDLPFTINFVVPD